MVAAGAAAAGAAGLYASTGCVSIDLDAGTAGKLLAALGRRVCVVITGPCVDYCTCPQCPIWVATVRYYVLVWYLSKCAREWTVI